MSLSQRVQSLFERWIGGRSSSDDAPLVRTFLTNPQDPNQGLIIDDDTSSLATIGAIHAKIHEGEVFEASYIVPHGSLIGDNVSLYFLCTTGTKVPHVQLRLSCGGDFEWRVYRGTARTGGTAVNKYNVNDNYATTGEMTITHTPGAGANGTARGEYYEPGGRGASAVAARIGATVRIDIEENWRPSTKYLVEMKNISGGDIQMGFVCRFYETDPVD